MMLMKYDFVHRVKRNEQLFDLCTQAYVTAEELYGSKEALGYMKYLFSRFLKPTYDEMRFVKGDPHSFAKTVGKRDAAVGLHVILHVAKNKIIYEFHDDPFPELKRIVDPRDFDATYMEFNIEYLLGNDWTYTTPVHIWENEKFTRHIITRKQKRKNHGRAGI